MSQLSESSRSAKKQGHASWALLWRLHYTIGILILPVLVLLCITGSIYLFKPQIEAFEEARIHGQASPLRGDEVAISADLLLSNVMLRHQGAGFVRYVMPKSDDRTAEFELLVSKDQQRTKLTLWVDQYTGAILAEKNSDRRFLHIVKKLHSELLLGSWGSYLVEFVASWAIVLVVLGIYLKLKKRAQRSNSSAGTASWRNRHGNWGLRLALPVLLMLLTGLPWTQFWGNGFKAAKETFGWEGPGQEWFVTLQSNSIAHSAPLDIPSESLWEINESQQAGQHHHHERSAVSAFDNKALTIKLADIVTKPELERLPHPIYIMPPKPDNGVWTVRAMPADRSQRVTVHYDQHDASEIMRIGFADHHPVQRAVSHGISLHEGALFGLPNLILALATAAGLASLGVTGLWLWVQRWRAGVVRNSASVTSLPSTPLLAVLSSLALFLPAVGLSVLGLMTYRLILSLYRS